MSLWCFHSHSPIALFHELCSVFVSSIAGGFSEFVVRCACGNRVKFCHFDLTADPYIPTPPTGRVVYDLRSTIYPRSARRVLLAANPQWFPFTPATLACCAAPMPSSSRLLAPLAPRNPPMTPPPTAPLVLHAQLLSPTAEKNSYITLVNRCLSSTRRFAVFQDQTPSTGACGSVLEISDARMMNRGQYLVMCRGVGR